MIKPLTSWLVSAQKLPLAMAFCWLKKKRKPRSHHQLYIFIKIKMMWVGSRAAGGSSFGFSFSHSQASLLQRSPEPRVWWGTSPAEPLASLGLWRLVIPRITWQDPMQAGCCSYILEWVKPSSLELQSISLPRPNDRSIHAFVLHCRFNNR